MKKILIATSALTALTFSSALALEINTSGVVEYYITTDDTITIKSTVLTGANNVIDKSIKKTSGNRKLSKKQAHVKFSAEGMGNGLAYGAYVKVGSGTNTPNRANYSTALNDKAGEEIIPTGVSATPYVALKSVIQGKIQTATVAKLTTGTLIQKKAAALVAMRGSSLLQGYTQRGQAVVWGQSKTTNDAKVWVESYKDSWNPGDIANNAKTSSGLWVSNSMGKVIISQDGSAAENAFMGDVKGARLFPSTLVSDPRGNHRTLYNTNMERITYESPEMNGFQASYTQAFKGNVSASKEAQVQAPRNYAITYKGDMNDVKFKLAYIGGRDAGIKKSEAPDGYTAISYKADAPKGTIMAGEVAYGKFTVGYNKFTNKKRYYQKKDTGGSIYGIRYFDTFWTVGYTVAKTEDKNTYAGHYASQGNTKAISATVWIDKGFNFYASQAKNTTTYNGLGTRAAPKTEKGKKTHTMFGIRATF